MTQPTSATSPLIRAVPDPAPAPSAWSRLVYHELRTSLAVVKGHVELLSDRAGDIPPDLRWSVHVLERAAGQLEKAVFMTCDVVGNLDRGRD